LGEHIHLVVDGLCVHCKVQAVIKQGKLRCPVAWRNGHGQRKKPVWLIEQEQSFLSPSSAAVVRTTVDRKKHLLGRIYDNHTGGQVIGCLTCQERAIRLPNGMFVCRTLKERSLRGIELAAKRAAKRRGEYSSVSGSEVTDADLGLVATTATREYRTLSGRTKGGPAPSDSVDPADPSTSAATVGSEGNTHEVQSVAESGDISEEPESTGTGDEGLVSTTPFGGKVRDLRSNAVRRSVVHSVDPG